MPIIRGLYSGICQLNIQSIPGIQNIQDIDSVVSAHFISASLFLSFIETCVLFSLFFSPSRAWKHEEFKIVIKPPVIQSLTFTSKAFCFTAWKVSQVARQHRLWPCYLEILRAVGVDSVFSVPELSASYCSPVAAETRLEPYERILSF